MSGVSGWWFMGEGLCLMVVLFGYKVDEVRLLMRKVGGGG